MPPHDAVSCHDRTIVDHRSTEDGGSPGDPDVTTDADGLRHHCCFQDQSVSVDAVVCIADGAGFGDLGVVANADALLNPDHYVVHHFDSGADLEFRAGPAVDDGSITDVDVVTD